MKYIVLGFMFLTIAACGKGGGGSNSSNSENSSEVRSQCDVKIDSSDLLALATSANKIRTECNLTEDQAVKHILSKY